MYRLNNLLKTNIENAAIYYSYAVDRITPNTNENLLRCDPTICKSQVRRNAIVICQLLTYLNYVYVHISPDIRTQMCCVKIELRPYIILYCIIGYNELFMDTARVCYYNFAQFFQKLKT